MTWQYFFGREKEIEDLCERIELKPLTVLFGKSGLGKTSLLQAGLMLELESRSYLPVYIRLDFSDRCQPLEEQVIQALFKALAVTPHRELGRALLSHDVKHSAPINLWNLFHLPDLGFITRSGKMLVRPVLILDQFEEVFNRAAARLVEDFHVALSDLVENRVPTAIQRRLDDDKSLLTHLVLPGQPCRVMLSLREDRLHELERWRSKMPSLLENRYELRSLTGQKALKAVYEPGGKRDEKPPIVGADLAAKIVRFVAGIGSSVDLNEISEVSPPLLSLMCREMNERRKREHRDQFDKGYLSKQKSEDILNQFYEQSLTGKPPVLRRLIEDELLSEDGKRRIPVALETILEGLVKDKVSKDVAQKTIEDVVSSRLLVYRELNNNVFVELTHDILTGVAKASRDTRRERETADEAAREVQKAKQNELEEANRRKLAEEREKREKANRVLAENATRKAIFHRNLAFAFGVTCLGCVIFIVIVLAQKRAQDLAMAENDVQLANNYLLQAGRAEWQPYEWRKGIEYLARALIKDPSDEAGAERFFHELMVHRVNAERLPLQTYPRGEVGHAVFSPDSQYLVTFANQSNEAQLRRTEFPKETLCVLSHERPILQVLFSPSSDSILTADDDGTAKLWKIEKTVLPGTILVMAKPLGIYTHQSLVLQTMFDKDGSKFLSMDANKTVYVWNTCTQLANRWNTFSPGRKRRNLRQALFSPDGAEILAVEDNSIELRDASSFSLRLRQVFEQPILQACFTPNGDKLVAVCSDHLVYYYNISKKEALPSIGLSDASQIWSIPEKQILPLSGVTNISQISDTISTPTGFEILTTTDDHVPMLWQVPRFSPTRPKFLGKFDLIQGRQPPIPARQGRLVITASTDGEAKIWDTSSGALQASLDFGGAISEMACSPDGKYVFTIGDDQIVMLWKIPLPSLDVSVRKIHGVSDSTFSPDDQRFVAASNDGTATVWEGTSGANLGTIEPHDSPAAITEVLWCRSCIVTARVNNAVNLWDNVSLAQIGQTITTAGPIYEVTSDEKGETILIAGDFPDTKLIEAKSGAVKKVLPSGKVWNGVFNRNGQEILTVCGDGKARLWDVGKTPNQAPKSEFAGLESPVVQAIFLDTIADEDAAHIQQWILNQWTLTDDAPTASQAAAHGGQCILTVSADGTAALWNSAEQAPQPFKKFKMPVGISRLVFDPNHQRILTLDAHANLELRDASSIESLCHSGNLLKDKHIQKASFSQGGEFVSTCDDDKTVKLFDASSGKLIAAFSEPATVTATSFSKDGTRMLIAAQDRVELRDIGTPKKIFLMLRKDEGFLNNGNLLRDEIALLGEITTGTSVSDSGDGGIVFDRGQLARNLIEEGKLPRDVFFQWLFCDDDKLSIFPGSKVMPSDWERNSISK